ncbi:anti-sigma factor domain-containing protein [Metabacillus sp. KIGAM252]|uniref:Anti-sigma factor domain-containing protein n=1 Tax=Metabacillus flavus TaxID=2823519 RepID=A0ABS5LD65_9BACI|nr:anti-sigma factor domain-containing protein [Metabacillus flavus]MBS2968534.1 anti-sigma factor domain-containing protein [Metabacillus flavus]
MKQGVIIDLKDNFAIVLTADGHFVKTRDVKSHYQLGEEITFYAAEASRASSPKHRGLLGLQQLRIGFVTAIAIILIFFSLYPVFNSDKVYAYMTIDINPSFELAINGNMEVVKLEPLNEDGEKLLSSFPNWNKQGFQSVVNSIITQSRTMGYTKSGKEILITTVVDRKNDKKFEANLLNHVQMMKSTYKSDPLIIETVQSDMETRKKAKSEGVSTGTYIRNHKPSEKSSRPVSDEKEEKPEPAEKPGTSKTPAPKENGNKNTPEPTDKTCREPSCSGTDRKPASGKHEPDPKALKEMEKKGKQPPAVPPKRDESSQIPAPKQENNKKNAEQKGFSRDDDDEVYAEDGEEEWEKNHYDDSHSEGFDDNDDNHKKKDKYVKDRSKDKKKDGLKANKQIKKSKEPDQEEDFYPSKPKQRVNSQPNENYAAREDEKTEQNPKQKTVQKSEQKQPELNPETDSKTLPETNKQTENQNQQ